tara:strand:+ start:632 stop:1540 length:909 start_codon:yes stop_codon:yes gene_type:complete
MASVSFIIPVYNKEKYLDAVLNSLFNQSGAFKREFIFINDGSTDKSLEIINSKIKKKTNSFVISQNNKGSASATNVGIKRARYKYIKFLDADDLIVFNATDSLLEVIENNKNINLVFGLQRKVSNLNKANLDIKINTNSYKIVKDPLKKAMKNSMFNPSQFLVRTKLCKTVGGCDERIKHSQEYSLTLKLAKYGGFAKLNEYIAILPKISPGQISEKKINQIYRVSKALEFFIKDNKMLQKKYKKFALRRLTGRSWRFAKRHVPKRLYFKYLKLYIKGLFYYSNDIENLCEEANTVYEDYLI